MAGEGERPSGGGGGGRGAQTGVAMARPAGSLRLPRRVATPGHMLGSVGSLCAVVPVRAEVPPLRSEACKKKIKKKNLKMAILGQGLRKTGEKGDCA